MRRWSILEDSILWPNTSQQILQNLQFSIWQPILQEESMDKNIVHNILTSHFLMQHAKNINFNYPKQQKQISFWLVD